MNRDIAAVPRSKAEGIGEALLAMGLARGPGVKLPTLNEMGAQFGVSRTTLERALAPLERRGLFVRKHGSGIYVSATIRQKSIGVVFGADIFSPGFSPFWSLLLQSVREQVGSCEMRARAYLDISQSYDGLGGHAQLIEDLEERRLDGLLLLSPRADSDQVGAFRSYGVPLVVFGGYAPDWTVTYDWSAFFETAARELAARRGRRIALLGLANASDRARLEQELRVTGVKCDPVLDWAFDTWAPRIHGTYSHEMFGSRLVQRMIAARNEVPLPDCLASMDDTMTRGAITALREAGLRPGRDLSIVTGANKGSPVLEPYAASLTRIEFDPAVSVRAALAMLQSLMSGQPPVANPVLVQPRICAGGGRGRVVTEVAAAGAARQGGR